MVKLNKKVVEGSVNTESCLGVIGEKLRAARQNKGLSLEDVQKKTKIHTGTIEALENGRLEDTLGGAYVRAFLKSYAAYLGMDAAVILEEYSSRKRAAEKCSAEPKREVPKKKAQAKNTAPNPEVLRAILSSAAVIIVIAVVIFGLVRSAQFAKSTIANMKIRKSATYKKSEPDIKETALTLSKHIVPIPKQDKLTLVVNTTEDVWLKVVVDGKVAFQKTLSKKSKEMWTADKEIKLAQIGKPEALKMNINGKELDFSENRLSRSILITHEGVDFEPK